jgi:hypothetical protein
MNGEKQTLEAENATIGEDVGANGHDLRPETGNGAMSPTTDSKIELASTTKEQPTEVPITEAPSNILPPDSSYGWWMVAASFMAHFA